MGLALIGGGVATTAGGVKLLRVYALYRNGRREMERLVHPIRWRRGSGRAGRKRRARYRLDFLHAVCAVAGRGDAAACRVGAGFRGALVLAIASLSTTGPLIDCRGDADRLSRLGAGKAGLCAAMVLGRLETLAIIALLTRICGADTA